MTIKRWILPDERGEAETEAAAAGVPVLARAVLAARGFDTPESAAAFISGESGGLASPYELAGMDAAVRRIHAAVENEERIAIYGDYDCDGITATALLTSYFQSVGADVIYYVPGRDKEGYGLNKGAVDTLRGQGVDLIVTVDNGISAHAEIAYAAALGIDTVVTDHHTPRETLPEAAAVVNPHRRDCPSRFKALAGVGVAFKLVCALEDADPHELLEYYAELVALGTVADVVSLTGENRIIVRRGLERLRETENPGILALLEVCGLTGKELSADSAAFGIIPRINACGRMGVADDAIELLLTDDGTAATEAAELVNGQNNARKAVEERIMAEIDAKLESDPALLSGRLLLLGGRGWHHGVTGIVAARLMERYGKPTVVFTAENGEARGSGRSIPGFSLINAITACNEKLTRYGGHTLAAGLTLKEEDLPAFMEAMELYAARNNPVMPVPELRVDCVLRPEELTIEHARSLAGLEPFGAGNEQPVFLLRGARVEGIYPTGDGKHLRIRLKYGNGLFYAVYFRMTASGFPFEKDDVVDVAATVSAGEWNGEPRLSVRICDMRPSGIDQDALILSAARYRDHLRGEYSRGKKELAPSREELAAVYRHIRSSGQSLYGPEELFYRLRGDITDFCRMRVAYDVLSEMGIIERHGPVTRLKPGAGKADLAKSEILRGLNT